MKLSAMFLSGLVLTNAVVLGLECVNSNPQCTGECGGAITACPGLIVDANGVWKEVAPFISVACNSYSSSLSVPCGSPPPTGYKPVSFPGSGVPCGWGSEYCCYSNATPTVTGNKVQIPITLCNE